MRIVATRRLFDFGDAAVGAGGELLELQGVMAGNNAVHGTGQFDHSRLSGDVGGVIGVGERGAGQVQRKIEIEIAIVGSENERRISLDAEILRGVGVAGAGVGANAGEDFDIVAIHQADAAFRVQLQ